MVTKHNAEKIIFDNDLTPVQAYNLAKATGVEAIDRFQLILEIFVRNASTSEANLQIQLAKLRYELSRAKERVRLARKEEQPGFMGLGKYEVNLYYETVRRRTRVIQEKLKKIREKRYLHRTRRIELGFTSISLAGYTNAGKSSLFNILAKERVPVDPGLFTTLSTTTRLMLLSKRKMLLTDTVGFINRLPLKLIQAFRSTLEETVFSELILLVVDVSESDEEIERKLLSCHETIRTIGALEVPIVTALNKIDLLQDTELEHKTEVLKNIAPNPISISALNSTNIDLLKQEIIEHLEHDIQASFSLPITDQSMAFVSWLFSRVKIQNVKYEAANINVEFASIPRFLDKVKGRVEQLGGIFQFHSQHQLPAARN